MKHIITIFAILFFAPSFVFASTPVSGMLPGNTTWSVANSPYVISTASVTVPAGVTLTIDPGVIVKFDSGMSLNISGVLNTSESATEQIYFTSLKDDILEDSNGDLGLSSPVYGDWGGINIASGGAANLNHITVRYAGTNISSNGGFLSLSNSIISSASSYGVSASGSGSATLNGNTFSDNTSGAVSVNFSGGLSLSNSGNTASGNGTRGIIISGTITTTEQRLVVDGLPYVLFGPVTVSSGKTLDIDPGVIVKLSGAFQNTAFFNIAGTLNALGTASSPIYFTSLKDDSVGDDTNADSGANSPAPYNWGHIKVTTGGTANFDYATIRYDGFNGLYNNGGTLNVSNSVISNCSSYGVKQDSGFTNISKTTIRDNVTYGIYAYGPGTLALTDNTFNTANMTPVYLEMSGGIALSNGGNKISGTALRGFDISGTMNSTQTWSSDGLPFIINSAGLTIASGKTLTLGAGVPLKFTISNLSVYGTLNAIGTKEKPISFTSYKDDSVFGDTNLDGATLPAPNDWGSIIIYTGGSATLDYSVVRYGGRYGIGNASDISNKGTLTVTNSEISYASNNGITQGMTGTASITNTSIHNNVSNGIYNWSDVAVNAVGNWWGSDTGPKPTGTGDAISGAVNYIPFLTSDPTKELPASLSNPKENEDDDTQDTKGEANKTNFGFSVSYSGSVTPDDVRVVAVSESGTSTLHLIANGNIYNATSTFPNGYYTYHFEAKIGTTIVKTNNQNFTAGYSNVMFLPGMEASRLYRPDYNGGTNRLWEPNSGNDAESLTLGDGTLPKDNDIYAEKNDVIDEAYIPLGLGPNIYKSFIESMNTLKNDDHLITDWSAVPYDWRLDYNEILTNGAEINGKIYYRGDLAATSTSYVIQELRRLASSSRTGKVTIIAHSNGGLLAKALTNFLGETESSKLIDTIVMVAVPQLGTPQAIGSVLNGHGQAIPTSWFYPFLSPQNARGMAQNMPVAYNLLPSEEYFHYVDDPVITISSSTLPTWATAYGTTTHSTIRLDNFMADVLNKRTKPAFDDVENPEIVDPAFLQRANAVHAILDHWTPPAGIHLVTIAGWGEETVSSIGYKTVKACTDASCYFLGDKVTETISHVIDGDGTVVEPSAHWANGANSTRYWVNLGNYNKYVPDMFATKHADILEISELRSLIKNILQGEQSPLEYISTIAPQYTGTTPRLHFTLHSPLTLEFYDTHGNHVGYSATTNSIEQDVPGVQYERYGEVQWISIPKDMAGRLVMRGTDSGSFALDTEEVNGNDVLSNASFEGVPSSINTIVTMNITPTQSVTEGSKLIVDENGDGTAEITLTAKSGEIVVPDSLPPHTTTTISGTLGTNGWYTSNISVTFSAIDDGSGVKSTLYSTDKGISWNSVIPLAISTEGTTTVQFYSVDNAGNKEATSTLVVKIDKTAPEVKISADATTKDLKIEGVDMNPLTVIKNVDNSYTITDLSGHTTKLFFQKTFLGKLLTYAKLTGIQYDTATKITLPSSSFVYLWNIIANPQTLLSQTIVVNDTYGIEAVFDTKKNQTTVLLKKKGVQIQKQTFTGLRIEKLTVEKGVVGYEI